MNADWQHLWSAAGSEAQRRFRTATPRAAHRIRRAYGKAVSPLRSATPFQMRLVSSQTTSHAGTMREKSPPWPHAPMHRLSQTGTYFVTSATNQKAHLPDEFDVSPER